MVQGIDKVRRTARLPDVVPLEFRDDDTTAAVVIYDLWENGSFPQLSAFGVLIFGLLIVLVFLGQSVGKRFGIQEQV